MAATGENDLEQLQLFLASQRLAVLATHQEGQPHTSLVAFGVTPDLREIVLATPRTTRKFTNLLADDRVALLFDNRSNDPSDFSDAMAPYCTCYNLDSMGIWMTNVVPLSTSLSTETFPPSLSMIPYVIERPSPVPLPMRFVV